MGDLGGLFILFAVLVGGWYALEWGGRFLSGIGFDAKRRLGLGGAGQKDADPLVTKSAARLNVLNNPADSGLDVWQHFREQMNEEYRKRAGNPTLPPDTPPKLEDVRRYANMQSAHWATGSGGMAELKRLIGLSGVKLQVEMVSNLAWVAAQRKKEGMKAPAMSYHMVFTGNPGTGKTTVARIVAKIFCELGVLKKGHLIEVGRKDLVAEYMGQSAPKTQKAIDDAIDGVLFIDEAYSIHLGHAAHKGDMYGEEVVATLIAGMENYRDRLIVIAAGYKDEMLRFLETNPGLESRFKTIIDFEDYGATELAAIFEELCEKEQFVLGPGAATRLEYVIGKMHESRGKNFGNGRAVRNLLDECHMRQAGRLRALGRPGRSDLMTLMPDDIGPGPPSPPQQQQPERQAPQASRGLGPIRWPGGELSQIGPAITASLSAAPPRKEPDELKREEEALERENRELMERLVKLGGEIEGVKDRKGGGKKRKDE